MSDRADWSSVALKRLLSFGNGRDHKAIEVYEPGFPVYGSGGAFAYASDFLFDGESVLFGRKGTVDKPLYVNERFWTVDTMYYSKIEPTCDARFLYYAALTIPFEMYSTNTALPSITQETLGKHKLLHPPLAEQQQIAAFLDYETAKIDALIEKQQQLIALLGEKRQAVISHAVTKGLNPDAPMRDSGIEWLGEVPVHWTVAKCGHFLKIVNGFAFPSADFSDNENDVRLLRGINVGVSEIRWDETVRWQRRSGDGLEPYELDSGDVVIGMDRPVIGDGVRVAEIGDDDLPCLLLQRVACLKCSKKLSSRYMLYLLGSDMFDAHFSPETTGVSVPHISPTQIGNFVIPLPTIEEQQAIVDEIDETNAKLRVLEEKANLLIDTMQERRTALISAAVTGKIDVRGWKPPSSGAKQKVEMEVA